MDDTNYVICPDSGCMGFTDKILRCGRNCPHDMKWMIVCSCGKKIYLPKDHFEWRGFECECGRSLFTRMSGKYERLNQ